MIGELLTNEFLTNEFLTNEFQPTSEHRVATTLLCWYDEYIVGDALFTWLFKYRPGVFEDGRFAFDAAHPLPLISAALVLLGMTWAFYRRQRSRVRPRYLILLGAIRLAMGLLLLLALLRPVIHISTAVAGENFLAIVLDDSRSMRLPGDGPLTRGAQALAEFTSPTSELAQRLAQRFTLRYYRFSDLTRRMDPSQGLTFDGGATHLSAALEQVRRDLSAVPLAGAVLVTDGADNDQASDTGETRGQLSESLLQLKSRGVPVYTVGLGLESFDQDIELTRVRGPNQILQGSSFTVDIEIQQQGYDGRTVNLKTERDGAIVESREIQFIAGQHNTTARVHLQADDIGPQTYHFSIDVQPEEQISENNAQDLLLMVEDRREKILYLEGEPRWEVKYLRMALAKDDKIQLVVQQRTARNKFLRLGVDDPLELISGFPSTREELFAYRGLILGSVSAGFFTKNQLRIIEEFVGERGGGLMLLGGRRSFAEGGFAGTVLEDVFPVVLEPPNNDFLAEVQVRPTLAGEAHAILRLGPSQEQSEQRWNTLPPLSVRNPLRRVKPGASLLLRGVSPDGADDLVVLASHRYGRGRAIALPVQDSWQWQMHGEISLEDMTHERLWRQMLRWLVSSVPRQVSAEVSDTQPAPGQRVILRAEVRDAAYLGLNGAQVEATVIDPLGRERTIPMQWTVENDGEYQVSLDVQELGPHEIEVRAEHEGEIIGTDQARLVAADPQTEYFDAEMNAPLLKRIAAETGGRFYTARDVENLAEDARFTSSGKTMEDTLELWDMPVLFLLLLTLICAEWLLRRRRGLI